MKIAIHTEALADYVSGGILCIVETLNVLHDKGNEVCVFLDKPPYSSQWIPAKFPVLPSASEEYEKFDGVLISPFSPTAKAVSEHANASERMYWVHTLEDKFLHNGSEWAERAEASYKLPLKLFATSHYVRIMLEMKYNRRVIGTLVPPGVDSEIFNNDDVTRNEQDTEAIRVLVLGRNDYCRGVDTALQAIKMAQREGLNIIPQIMPVVREREMVAHYFKNSDIYIDCSRLAGSPCPAKEAMACGCVPICTPYGTTDFVLDGHNGYIVPPDDPQAVVGALKRYSQKTERASMSTYASDLIWNEYTWGDIAKRMLMVIDEARARGDELLQLKQW